MNVLRCALGRRTAALGLAGACVLSLLSLSPAAAERWQAPWAEGTVFLEHADAQTRLRFPDGEERSLRVAPEVRLRRLATWRESSGRQRWLLAGEVTRADGSVELWLTEGGARGSRRLPAPPRPAGVERRSAPALLTSDGGLEGAVWLEGEEASGREVWAADWLGDRFGDPYPLARRGPGSQLALTATVLDDGRWLVAWSAFDGRDDEIVWALRDESGWQGPQRAHRDNDVPDVTPELVTTEGGALLAWSRYDGNDYRLHLASFVGDGFLDLEVDSEPGSLYPRFVDRGATPVLTWYRAVPQGWSTAELDAQGRVLRRATVDVAHDDAPFVEIGPDGLVLVWTGVEGGAERRAVPWSAPER